MNGAAQLAAGTRLLILDVDGVLTDGRLYYGEAGEHFRAFHVRDGLGIRWLTNAGIQVAVISGRRSSVLAARLEPLGVEHIFQGYEDKLPAFEELLARLGLQPSAVTYMGDDVQDLPVMERVAFATTVADGHPAVRRRAHWVSEANGGQGAVRELCELVLHAQGKLSDVMQSYLAGAHETNHGNEC